MVCFAVLENGQKQGRTAGSGGNGTGNGYIVGAKGVEMMKRGMQKGMKGGRGRGKKEGRKRKEERGRRKECRRKCREEADTGNVPEHEGEERRRKKS